MKSEIDTIYIWLIYILFAASSLTSTTPKSAPTSNPLAPWLVPSNPVLSTESKSVGSISGSGSGSTSVKDVTNPSLEESLLSPELNPFGAHQVLGNQSIYGVGSGIPPHGDFEHPSILHTTPTTISPSSYSSTSAVLSNEGDPFSPFGGGGGRGANRETDDADEPNSSSEDEPPLDTDFKRWPRVEGESGGRASSVDGTESWWSSQFERPKEPDASNGDGDNMWPDKENGATASKPNLGGKTGLGVPKGVVTLSPTIMPPQTGHQEVEIEQEDEKDANNKRISSSGMFF